MTPVSAHGGTDAGPPIAHDFSSNASPLGPPPALLAALQAADRRRYPDPQYTALRAILAAAHGVPPELVLPAAGGAEAIRRLSLAALLQGRREVWVPQPGFGDYALAAAALGLAVHPYADATGLRPRGPALIWICEPCNPTGASLGSAALQAIADAHPQALIAVDRAYEPLRLHGEATRIPASCWQLLCPNKGLGLTGVRAAYLLAPAPDAAWAHMNALAASWVLSVEGQVMLERLHMPDTQAWLAGARAQLHLWAASQRAMLADFGWTQAASDTPFWLARPPRGGLLAPLRERGIKLRDAASFGLAGQVRIATLPPESRQALQQALEALA